MKIVKTFEKNKTNFCELLFENKSEMWFGDNIISKLENTEKIENGYILPSLTYIMLQEEIVKRQKKIAEKYGFSTVEELRVVKKKSSDQLDEGRDLLFLN